MKSDREDHANTKNASTFIKNKFIMYHKSGSFVSLADGGGTGGLRGDETASRGAYNSTEPLCYPPIDIGGQLVVMQRPSIYFNSAFLLSKKFRIERMAPSLTWN